MGYLSLCGGVAIHDLDADGKPEVIQLEKLVVAPLGDGFHPVALLLVLVQAEGDDTRVGRPACVFP